MSEERNMDKLIRENLEIDKTNQDLTGMIMQNIHSLEHKNEKALRSVLQSNLSETAPEGFTLQVMSQIVPEKEQYVYQPVISKKVWIAIAVAVVLIVIFSLPGILNEPDTTGMTDNSLAVTQKLATVEYPSILNSPLFALSMFALSSLLLLDYFIRNKKISS